MTRDFPEYGMLLDRIFDAPNARILGRVAVLQVDEIVTGGQRFGVINEPVGNRAQRSKLRLAQNISTTI